MLLLLQVDPLVAPLGAGGRARRRVSILPINSTDLCLMGTITLRVTVRAQHDGDDRMRHVVWPAQGLWGGQGAWADVDLEVDIVSIKPPPAQVSAWMQCPAGFLASGSRHAAVLEREPLRDTRRSKH